MDEIEKELFNKTYKNRDFHTRIVTIERKLFGKIYDVDDYSTRMDRIKEKMNIGRSIASSKDDVFEDYTEKERNRLFGTPPATVWDNMEALRKYPEKVKVITSGGALREQIINSFREAALLRWKIELIARILPELRDVVRKAKKIDSEFVTDQDAYAWNKIFHLRAELAKDSIDEKSLFTRLINALNSGKYDKAAKLQVEIYEKIEELKTLYDSYEKNMI